MRTASLARRASIFLAFVLVIIAAASAISCVQENEATNKIGVIVTIPPLAEFAKRVGGEKVDVAVIVPPGANPHIYELPPSQMKDVARAEMYVKVGSGIEFELAWMDKIIAQNDDMLIVDGSKEVPLLEMAGGENQGGAGYEPGAADPHIWMSPLNARIMVQNIYEGLAQIDPDNETYYERNRNAYLQELDELDKAIRDGLSQVTNRRFMVYHPTFGYFAEEYDLTMISIQEEGKEPTAAGLAHLIDQAREYNIRVIFASPQFNPESAEVIADEIGGRVVFVDSLAEDYIANLRTLLSELVAAME